MSSIHFVYAVSVKCGRGWNLSLQRWTEHRLLLIRGGTGYLHHCGKTREIKRGFCLMGLPSEVYGVSQNEKQRLTLSVVRFQIRKGGDSQLPIPSQIRPGLCFQTPDFPLVEQLILRLTFAVTHPSRENRGLSESLLATILNLAGTREQMNQASSYAEIANQDLRPALEFPWTPSQPMPSTEHLARICGMNPVTFRRKFLAVTGRSPRHYLLEKRISRAREMLLESPHTIAAIAEELGFSEAAYFNRQFSRFTGMSPGRFRTSHG